MGMVVKMKSSGANTRIRSNPGISPDQQIARDRYVITRQKDDAFITWTANGPTWLGRAMGLNKALSFSSVTNAREFIDMHMNDPMAVVVPDPRVNPRART